MSTLIKMATITLMINLMLYVGMGLMENQADADGQTRTLNSELTFHFNNDLIDDWMTTEDSKKLLNYTKEGYNVYQDNYTSGLLNLPDKQVGASFNGEPTSIDVVASVWKFLATFGNIAIAPLTFFSSYRTPVYVRILVGIPYVIIFMLTIIFFIRGVSD